MRREGQGSVGAATATSVVPARADGPEVPTLARTLNEPT